MNDDTRERMRTLYESGLSIRRVAAAVGVSSGCVQYNLDQMGVRLRSKSEAREGFKPSAASIEKMRRSKVGKSQTPESNKKRSLALKGRKKSAEFCRRMSASRMGPNNPNYNPDGDKVERARLGRTWWLGYGKWVEMVHHACGWRCIVCGGTAREGADLVAHHLDNYYDFEDSRTDVNNGVTLCVPCHVDFHAVHGRKGNTRRQFEAYRYKVTKCMKRMKPHIDDPGAFCAALKDRIEGTTFWRGKKE